MRRVMTLIGALALLGSLLAGPAMAAKPVTGGDGVNPHIIADGTYLDVTTYNGDNGELRIYWKVAGLGKYGSAYLRIRGWVTMDVTCSYKGGSRTTTRVRDIRINGSDIYSDASGNATGGWQLRPNAVCTKQGTVVNATGNWTGLGVDLYSVVDRTKLLDWRDLAGCLQFGTSPVPCP